MAAIPSRRIEWSVLLASVALAAIMIGLMSNIGVITGSVTLATGILVAWITWQDINTFTIPDAATLAIALVALAGRIAAARIAAEPMGPALMTIAIDGALPGGLLLLFREIYYRRKGYDGLGLGDVKLAAAGGIFVGAIAFFWALFAASLLALGFVTVRRLATRRTSRLFWSQTEKLAFGAALAPALWAIWIAEQVPALLALTEP